MYQSPGGPYPNGFRPFYPAAFEERDGIRRTANRTSWTVLAGLFLMTILFPGVGAFYLKSIGVPVGASGGFDGIPPVLYYLLLSIDYVLGMALPALIYFSAAHIPLAKGLPFGKVSAAQIALFVAFGCMVCMLANYPANLVAQLQERFGFSGDIPPAPLNNDPRVLALYGLSVVVIPPIVEEMMFRGVVLQSLRRYGDGFAVVVSAIFFGLYHGNPIQMVFAFLSGLALGYVVIRTGSLLPSILIHCINNGVSYAVEMVTRFYGQNTANTVNAIFFLTFIVLGVGALFVLGRRHLLFTGKQSGSVLPFSSRLFAAFTNFGAVWLIVYAVISSCYTLTHG